MSGRRFAQLEICIWRDKDFRKCSGATQRVFMLLFSQAELSWAGVLTLAVKRWANMAADTTENDVEAALTELVERRFVVIDEETQELLVRAFIRRDEGWKNSKKMWPPVRQAALQVESQKLRQAIAKELGRLPHDLRPNDVPEVIRELVFTDLNGDPIGDTDGVAVTDQTPSTPLPVDNSRNPRSIGDAVTDANSDGITPVVGKYVTGVVPTAPTTATSPPPPPSRFDPPEPSADDAEEAGEGDPPRDPVAELVAAVQTIRPEWGTTAVRTTLDRAREDGRPWRLASDAMLRVARAPDSRSPARLLEQGPWWSEAVNGSRARPARPADLAKCAAHPGELASNCRCCAADRKAAAS
jgi:hypothetical protein